MEHTPLVTVLVTTYNQEKYIAQALDSVLAQKTDFPFEIYVSEDCGTDGTRDILKEYARRYPQIIRLNLREKNVGISRNWYEGLCAARGAGGFFAFSPGLCGGEPHHSPDGRRGQHLWL